MAWLRLRHVLLTVVLFGYEPVFAQSMSSDSAQFQARIDEVARGLASQPRLKKVSDQKRQQLAEFVVGNMLFALLHETGHALVTEMELPVLGRDEDAADAFAVVMLLKVGSAMSHRVVVEAAKAWFLTDLRDKKEGDKPELYDSHGLSEQRAYHCLLNGRFQQGRMYHLNVPIVDHEGWYTSAIDRRSIIRLLYGIEARKVLEIGVGRGETAMTVLQNNEYIEELFRSMLK
jgi:hypothetical protein